MKENIQREADLSPFFYNYLITDPTEYGLELTTFEKNLTKVLQTNHVDILCFRDKITKDIKPFAKTTLKLAREFGVKIVLINGHRDLAVELGFDGVHLTSTQFDEISKAKEQNLFTFISTHSEDEIKFAKANKADGVTYSPIFYKLDKGEPKGCLKLVNIVEKYQNENFSVIALGGITDPEKVKEVEKTGCRGFASISYFTNNL